jgi:transcriptional regulator with XRE-family HTH domain
LNTPVAVAFGKVLRKSRKDKGLSQEELGLEAGLQRNYISELERGEKQPTITTLFKLAIALKIKPGKLIELVERDMS